MILVLLSIILPKFSAFSWISYISKSIIFIHKNKVLNTNIEDVEYLYELIEKFLSRNEKETFNKIKSYILYFNIDMTDRALFSDYLTNGDETRILGNNRQFCWYFRLQKYYRYVNIVHMIM